MEENLRLLIKVAKLYYENGLTQEAISQQLRLSRPKISRLLQQARDEHIVQIKITAPSGDHSDIEQRLEAAYGLKEAVVVDVANTSRAGIIREVGAAAANYVSNIVRDGDLIGVTWGATLGATVDALMPQKMKGVGVVQMVGGLGEPGSETFATDLARRLSQIFDANLSLIPAPGIVQDLRAREILMSDRYIRQSMEMATHADLVLAGIGATTDALILQRGEIITSNELNTLITQGAVGDISLRFFDVNGNPVQSEIDQRVIGVDLATLRSLPRVIGVAGGEKKCNAILGALRGKYINSLVTDYRTALSLLESSEEVHRS